MPAGILLAPVAHHGGFQETAAEHRRMLQIPRGGGRTLVSESTVGRGAWAGKCRYFPRSHTRWI